MKKTILIAILSFILCFVAVNSYATDSLGVQELWARYRGFVPNPGSTFSHDGRFLFFNGQTVYKLNSLTGELVDSLNLEWGAGITHLNVLPGDSIIAMIYNANIYDYKFGPIFYNLNTNKFIRLDSIERHSGLYFSPDYSKFMAYNLTKNQYDVYRTNNLAKIKSFGTVKIINDFRDEPIGWIDDSTFISISDHSSSDYKRFVLKKYNINSGLLLNRIFGYFIGYTLPALSSDGHYVAVNNFNGGKTIICNTSDLSIAKEINIPSSITIFDKTSRYIFLSPIWLETYIYDLQSNKSIYKVGNLKGSATVINDSNNLIYTESGHMFKLNWNNITDVLPQPLEMQDKLKPNPTTGVVDFNTNIKNSGNYDLKLISSDGRTVKKTFLVNILKLVISIQR